MKALRTLTFASLLALAAVPAVAHDAGTMGNMSNMPGMKMDDMLGMHDMAVTVTTVDAKTGMVDANAGGMALKVHFPPAALSGVKAGDHITLHLSFTKP
ncbi:MAG: hypothetical protein ISS15_20990 [Alphaproteobacteria bacterium]|jgi:hypothetical protein|nr:hypothetical protein [Reyranella sp.]MBL6940055.1 hypothetical protein [Alphaproteobacteria bacterium]MBL7100142.1 hypothetical protein [Alphaproteobacteria bacterium]